MPTIKVSEKEYDWIRKYSPYRKNIKDTGKGKFKHKYGVRRKSKIGKGRMTG